MGNWGEITLISGVIKVISLLITGRRPRCMGLVSNLGLELYDRLYTKLLLLKATS